ncbi:MAG: sigma-70 family RNA polymerase sigma factor [Planctomycetes bacterium]|nr:sigma-70 family RNA polymerase sigma factor [Planctomycetota bacterium]
MSPAPVDPQSLLEHGAFVRALVRSLIADEHRAADVEQQTWLAALRRPPRRVDRARAFLAIIAKNFARRAHRDERRREERVRDCAEFDDVAPSPDEVLELEARRKHVIDAVLQLEPPYRSVVLLRYVSDLSPAEIAARLDEPLETVKTRLKRALAMLRARFDAEHAGDRSAWCAVFAPLAGWSAPANAAAAGAVVGATWITGALIMKVLAWSAAAVTTLAVVGMLWTWGDDATDAQRDASAVAATSDAATGGASEKREAIADASPTHDRDAESTQRTSLGGSRARDAVFGIVRDSNSSPVAGARVELRRNVDELGASLLETRPAPPVFADSVTGQGGRFSIEVRSGRLVDVFASHREYAVAGAVAVTVGDEVELVLQDHASVFGRITRKADGQAVVRATVRLFNAAEPWRDLSTTPDADGLFSFRAVVPGRVTLAVAAADLADPPWERLDLKPGEAVRRDVVLDDGVVVRGRVTDAVTKAPIADAEISAGWTFRSSVRSDADGRYEYRGYGEWGVYDLHCRADGYGRTETEDFALDPARTAYVIDFVLRPGRRVSGVVVDRTGRPVASATITAFANSSIQTASKDVLLGNRRQCIDQRTTTSADDGSFAIEDLRPELHHALHIAHGDHGTTVFDFPSNEFDLPVVAFGRIALASRQRVRGRVVDADGNPVARTTLTLHGTNADSTRYSKQDEPWFNGYVDELETRSAADGTFAFDRVAPGSYSLRHTRPSQQQSTKLAVVIEDGHDVEGIELRIPTTLTIRGRVVSASGSLPSWVTVLARRTDGPGGPEGNRRVEPDGSFTIELDVDGIYTVDARPSRDLDDPKPPLLSGSIDGVKPAGPPIELVLPVGASIRGRVVDTEGKPASSAHVVLDDAAGQPRTWTLTRGGGRFELAVEPGTVGSLRARTYARQTKLLMDSDVGNDGDCYSPTVPARDGDVDVELVVPVDP